MPNNWHIPCNSILNEENQFTEKLKVSSFPSMSLTNKGNEAKKKMSWRGLYPEKLDIDYF